jgi:hypothetical protein
MILIVGAALAASGKARAAATNKIALDVFIFDLHFTTKRLFQKPRAVKPILPAKPRSANRGRDRISFVQSFYASADSAC